jgi:hypothetical protein
MLHIVLSFGCGKWITVIQKKRVIYHEEHEEHEAHEVKKGKNFTTKNTKKNMKSFCVSINLSIVICGYPCSSVSYHRIVTMKDMKCLRFEETDKPQHEVLFMGR